MLIDTTQGNIEFTIPKHFKSIGYKVSGGADSAIVGWMLCKTIVEECNSEPVVYPITMDQPGKAYQVKFAKGVVAFLKLHWPLPIKSWTCTLGLPAQLLFYQSNIILKGFVNNKRSVV